MVLRAVLPELRMTGTWILSLQDSLMRIFQLISYLTAGCGAGVVRDWQDFCHRPRSRGQVLFSGAWLRLGTFFLWQELCAYSRQHLHVAVQQRVCGAFLWF
mmetsp:Transcript_11330/g.27302  ORF Transcript_11330/g.27302 Transcript_11330/m.27302 type:complete len:101 (-) Transcript_11330:304-606(-)